jgi:hypothetical protein
MSLSASDVSNATDLGRRIRARRTELDLTVEQVAERAAMAPGYLDYLEQAAGPNVSNAALLRLAQALEVPTSELLGGGRGRAHGGGPAADGAVLTPLTTDECAALLRRGGIGRLVFRVADRPVAFPVNFAALGCDVVFRSTEGGAVSEIASDEPVSLEVDRIDDAMSDGWSVLATGRIHKVRDPDEMEAVEALGIVAWAGRGRHAYFRLAVTTLTGRTINAAGDAAR